MVRGPAQGQGPAAAGAGDAGFSQRRGRALSSRRAGKIGMTACRRRSRTGGLRRRAEHRSRQESQLTAIVEREHPAPTRNDIDDEVGMLPDLELGGADVERSSADMPEQHVRIANDEIVFGVAHRRRSVAAASGLMKQHRTMLGYDLREQLE